MQFNQVIDTNAHPLQSDSYRQKCKQQLNGDGVLVLHNFLQTDALIEIAAEGKNKQHLAFYTRSGHNVYLTPPDPNYSEKHARNYRIESSKGCITDDQIDAQSPLRTMYDADELREFLAVVLGGALVMFVFLNLVRCSS